MKTKSVNYYTIEELKTLFPETYKNVLEKHRDWNIDGKWYEATKQDCKTMLAFCGFSDVEIRFSGFGSQGDGASFTGSFNSQNIDIEALETYAPNEKAFLDFARFLTNRRDAFKPFTFALVRSTRLNYVHENTVYVDNVECEVESGAIVSLSADITIQCRSVMREIYRRLEEEYYYLSSDDSIAESLAASEMYFDENGRPE